MKYKDWLIEWLNSVVKPTVKSRTYVRYEQIANSYIIPNLGEYELNDLSPLLLQQFVTGLLQKTKLSPSTVNIIITAMQGSLKSAVAFSLVKEYTANKIKRPKSQEKEVACFSLSEQKKIEQYVVNSGKGKLFGIVLCLYTGLRIGELLSLTWGDLDFKKGVLSVNKSCHYGATEQGKFSRYEERPKTNSSCRVIPIPKQLLIPLKDLKKKSKSKYIIANNEKPLLVRSYQRTFERLLKKLNIEHKGFHSLRHTFATRALECGMDVKTLSEILGHKNTNITLNRYVHSLMEHKSQMMNKLGKLFQ